MEEQVVMVRGRRLELAAAAELRALAQRHERVVLDLGTGDGRWVYRLARVHPSWLCLGVDANAGGMREVSFRAARKPARGGLANARFIAAAAEALPGALRSLADVVHVSYPWGSLLRAVLRPDPCVLRGIAEVLKPGGLLVVAVNASVLGDGPALGKAGLAPRAPEQLHSAAARGYGEAGLILTTWASGRAGLRSSWAGRLGQGGPVPMLWLEAVKRGDGRGHGRG